MRKPILIIFFTVLLTACSGQSSNSAIQTVIVETSIVETEYAFVAEVVKPAMESTSIQYPANIPSATSTITPSPTPEFRIVNGVPRDFQLEREDMPPEGKYYMPNSTWSSPHTNAEVTAGWTVAKGLEYLEDTGRVTGWWSAFRRGTSQVSMPYEVYCNVIQYETAEGAHKGMTKYPRSDRITDVIFHEVNMELDLGDSNRVEYAYKEENAEVKIIFYYIDFTYKNFLSSCYGYGTEPDVTHEFVEHISRIMLNKLKSAELIVPPTVTPTITEAP
jgi:Prokaryotic membrane lipoprotein lipid attachment site